MSKDNENHEKGAAPDNIVRVDFGRARAAAEDVSEKKTPDEAAPAKVQSLAERKAEKQAGAAQSSGGVLSFGDPRIHERLRLFSDWIRDSKVMLVIDATRDDVQVPPQFKNNPELRLDFSLRFGISDFVYDRQSVRCTLSFGGKGFYCVIPWPAILMMYAHETRAVVFFDDEILEESEESEVSEAAADSEVLEDSEVSEDSESGDASGEPDDEA